MYFLIYFLLCRLTIYFFRGYWHHKATDYKINSLEDKIHAVNISCHQLMPWMLYNWKKETKRTISQLIYNSFLHQPFYEQSLGSEMRHGDLVTLQCARVQDSKSLPCPKANVLNRLKCASTQEWRVKGECHLTASTPVTTEHTVLAE